jgi:hypothetical protein
MENHENTDASAKGALSKKWILFAVAATVLVVLSAGVVLIKPRMNPFGFAPEVELVRDGRFSRAPWATVGESFEQFLSNPEWAVIHTEDGAVYVNLTGELTYMNKPVEGLLQFSVDMDATRWEFVTVEFNGIPQNKLVMAVLAKKASENVSTPFATAYREARQNIASIRTAEMSYFAEFGEYVSAAPHPAQMDEGGAAWGEYKGEYKDAEGFNKLAFSPDDANQRLHCTYAVSRSDSAFTAAAKCNGGSDGPILWGYVKPGPNGNVVAGPFGKCGTDGVWSADGKALGTKMVGLCSKPS